MLLFINSHLDSIDSFNDLCLDTYQISEKLNFLTLNDAIIFLYISAAIPNTDMDFPQKNDSFSQNPDNWVSSKKCPMAFPIEILEKIMFHASLVTQLKIRSTCRFFHKANAMEKCISDINCAIVYGDYVLESTTITHIITNMPFDICARTKAFFYNGSVSSVCNTQIPLCDLKYFPLSENFCCYQLSTPIKCKGFSLGLSDHFDLGLAINSETRLGRHHILNELSLQPVHCSNTTIGPTKGKFYKLIVCTTPLILNLAS